MSAGSRAIAVWISGLSLRHFGASLRDYDIDCAGLLASQHALVSVAGHLTPAELHAELEPRQIDTAFLRRAFSSELQTARGMAPVEPAVSSQIDSAANGGPDPGADPSEKLSAGSLKRFTTRQLRKVLEAHGLSGCALEIRDLERQLQRVLAGQSRARGTC